MVITSAVWVYEIAGSPGTCRLPVHMNVHLPATVAYAETRLVLLELSMLTVLMFTLVVWSLVNVAVSELVQMRMRACGQTINPSIALYFSLALCELERAELCESRLDRRPDRRGFHIDTLTV